MALTQTSVGALNVITNGGHIQLSDSLKKPLERLIEQGAIELCNPVDGVLISPAYYGEFQSIMLKISGLRGVTFKLHFQGGIGWDRRVRRRSLEGRSKSWKTH